MNKLKEPVIFTIEGTGFLVDIDKQVLRQTDNRQNTISFLSDMQDRGDHYILLYDIDRKNTYNSHINPRAIRTVRVPGLAELDPAGMSEKYGIPVEQIKGKTDFEIIVDQQALEQRHRGELPRIDLAGDPFIIDLRLQELRHAKNFHPVISLKSFELTGDGWHYEGYYHTTLRQLVPIDPGLTEFPDHVVRLRLPNEIGLDPVATARAYDMDEKALLRRFPIQKNMKAAVIPLSETNIPALIAQNREKLREEHAAIAKKAQPRHRPGF